MPMSMAPMNRLTRGLSVYRARRFGSEFSGYHHSLAISIYHSPGSTQEQLAERLCLNKSTVARGVTLLESRGYVTRTPNPSDKRELLVEPTDKLREIIPTIHAISYEWNAHVSEGISEEELQVFSSVLRRMEENARRFLKETEVSE